MQKHFFRFRKVFKNIAWGPLYLISNNLELVAKHLPNDFESIKKEKCFGKKSAYMIEKVEDEIVLAKARRESDGTYSA